MSHHIHKSDPIPDELTLDALREWPTPMSKDEAEMAFYEQFFISKDMEPYPVQEEAFHHIFAGDNVLVMVPTGTGKTMIAKAGLMKALYTKQTAIYTTPLRALTEEKYRELCGDFGAKYVGFATGDYKINPHAPIQVMVAEIVWNMIFGGRRYNPADIIVMDEGHYFNDPERGHVWEQSIIGLDPATQLVILSATVGNPQQFCQWNYLVRGKPMTLVQSNHRRVPLFHHYEENYLIEQVRELHQKEEVPAIIFCFNRQQCFDYARELKSCRRFTTDEEQAIIAERAAPVLHQQGLSEQLLSYLTHGIGIHHAGILPTYKQLIEELTLDRLLKFVVSTETISAGINLPAKRVLFPALRKHVKRASRLLLPAEYHQMAGRAGRPQFDTEGIAITLAPEEVVQEYRKELKEAEKSRYKVDPEQIKKRAYSRARTEARKRGDISWDPEEHQKLVEGQPAALQSQTKITASQILAIGLPDLTQEILPGVVLVEAELQAEAKRQAEREAQLSVKMLAKDSKTDDKPKPKSKDKSISFGNKLAGLSALLSITPATPESQSDDSDNASHSKEDADNAKDAKATDNTEATDSTEATGSTDNAKDTDNQDKAAAAESDTAAQVVTGGTSGPDSAAPTSRPDNALPAPNAPQPATAQEVSPDAQATEQPAEATTDAPSAEAQEAAPETEGRPSKRRSWPAHLPLVDALTEALATGEAWPKDAALPPPLSSRRQDIPAHLSRFNIVSIIDKLFVDDNEKREAHKLLAKITNNLQALGILDEHGQQQRGWIIGALRGIDGPFVYFCLMHHDFNYVEARELVETIVDHDVIHRILNRKVEDEKREWMRNRMRERRQDEPLVSWDDVEAEYERKFPRPRSFVEQLHDSFLKKVPHPELHISKRFKSVWATMEDQHLPFLDFIELHKLQNEEGNLFSYLSRILKTARMLYEVSSLPIFRLLELRVRSHLGRIDHRILDGLWQRRSADQLFLQRRTPPKPCANVDQDSAIGYISEESGEDEGATNPSTTSLGPEQETPPEESVSAQLSDKNDRE